MLQKVRLRRIHLRLMYIHGGAIDFIKDLIEAIKWSDVPFRGVYSFHNILVGHIVRKINVPYVVTLHNGLSPELSGIKEKNI